MLTIFKRILDVAISKHKSVLLNYVLKFVSFCYWGGDHWLMSSQKVFECWLHIFLLLFLLLKCFYATIVNNILDLCYKFVSLDCRGEESYTDELGLNWNPDSQMMFWQTGTIAVANETRKQYTTYCKAFSSWYQQVLLHSKCHT